MNARFFLDTNVFAYSFDDGHPAKKRRAQALIEQALGENAGFISYQVVQEFLHVALRKFEKPLSASECQVYLDDVLMPLCEVFPSRDLYRQALSIQSSAGFGFFDSLIVASALEGGGRLLYSEDIQSGQKLSELTIQNPF